MVSGQCPYVFNSFGFSAHLFRLERGTEPMVMIPMGLGMVAINCGTLIMPDGTLGNLF